LKPDLLVMDLMLPVEWRGRHTSSSRFFPGYTSSCCPAPINWETFRARCGGRRGYVVKEAVGSELACAVRTVMAGKQYLSRN